MCEYLGFSVFENTDHEETLTNIVYDEPLSSPEIKLTPKGSDIVSEEMIDRWLGREIELSDHTKRTLEKIEGTRR